MLLVVLLPALHLQHVLLPPLLLVLPPPQEAALLLVPQPLLDPLLLPLPVLPPLHALPPLPLLAAAEAARVREPPVRPTRRVRAARTGTAYPRHLRSPAA